MALSVAAARGSRQAHRPTFARLKTMITRRDLLFSVPASMAASRLFGAQQPTFRVGAQNVPVYVTVTDANKRLVPGLEQEDFEIYDEKTKATISIFDNGCHRFASPTFSRVIEIDPATNETGWRYLGEPIVGFYSYMGSGASRLANGNVFITEAATGRLFEVTAEGETVWEYVSPFVLTSKFGPTPALFRAHRFDLDDPRFAGKELSPERYAELNRRIEALAEAQADVCARRGITYVDCFRPLVSHDQWMADLAASPDRAHPGQAGYGLIAWLVLHNGWNEWLGIS